jgi:hypothetical protein
MASIADSLAIEVLSQVLQHVQNAYRNQIYFERDKVDPIRIFAKPAIRYSETREFRFFRLVSRKWKAIADTILFRDVRVVIGNRGYDKTFIHNYGYYSRGHRFLDGVFREGYMGLVRNVYVGVGSSDDELEMFDHDPGLRAILTSYTDLVCDLLGQPACRCIHLLFEIPSSSSESIRQDVAYTILDALWKPPEQCTVTLSTFFRDNEEWFTATVPQLVSDNLTALEITSPRPVSPMFLASLRRTKSLHLAPNIYRPHTGNEYEELAAGLNMMPALEELCLVNLPTFSIPKTLRRFSFTAPRRHVPNAEFLARLYQLDGLQDLRLSFDASSYAQVDELKIPLSLTNWPNSAGPRLPQLRILQVTSSHGSTLLNIFCSQILPECHSLEEVKLFGVGFRNEDILGVATRPLRKISLCGSFDIFGGVPNRVEDLQWSSLCTLFERNPQTSHVRLGFELGLHPLTYENIESISKSCPRLECIFLEISDMSDHDHATVEYNGSASYRLDWLYCGSLPANDVIMEKVIWGDCSSSRSGDSYDDGQTELSADFFVDLSEFRILKDREVAEAET